MTFKKCITILIMLMLLPMLCGSAIKLPELKDIEGHWASEYINECTERGICVGYDNGYFMPSKPVTRAEFTKMVVIAFSISDPDIDPDTDGGNNATIFDDVIDHWSESYIKTAYASGLIFGVDDNRFMPDKEISRQDAVLILSRIEHSIGKQLPETIQEIPFIDGEYIREECREAVTHFQKASIISGKTGNMFDPIGSMTRAEAAKCIILTIRGFETPAKSPNQ
ncbi:MAG: S-layer homology domain-containing protein [Eubacteriales bacterium]|jgi:hypothetical protein